MGTTDTVPDQNIPPTESTPSEAPQSVDGVAIAKEPQKNQSKIFLFSLLGLALLVGVGYGGYWYATTSQIANRKPPIVKPEPKTPTPGKPTPTIDEQTRGWKTYRNEKYGFEIKCAPGVDFEFGKTHPQANPEEFPRFYLKRYKDAPGMVLFGYANPEGKSLSQLVESLYRIGLREAKEKDGPSPQKLENPRYIDVNGVKTYQGTMFAFDSIELVTYIPGGSFVIQILLTDTTDLCLKGTAEACSGWYTEEDKDLLIRTLQTFKFTE